MLRSEKFIIVTGASRGLGLEIAIQAAEAGYRVIGVSRTRSNDYNTLIDEGHSFIKYDLMDLENIPSLIKQISDFTGNNIYGLVNNSGIGLDGLLATQHSSDIAKILRLNLEAPITLSKYVVRQMLKNRCGRIINISSIIAKTGFNGLSVYGASKAGLEGFTRSLSREVGRAGITVNSVAPGFMATDMTKGLEGSKLASIARRTSVGLPETQHAASAVLYFLSSAAEKTTGTVLTVDGGSTA